jgi:Uma2 family endonuclease
MNEMVDQFRAIADAAPKDPDAFVRWVSEHTDLERLRLKLELSHGKVDVSVINTTRFHSNVIFNLNVLLGRVLDRELYSVHGPDFAVRTPFGIRGPDITIDRAGGSGKDLIANDPIVLIEVASPSSLARDFHDKPDEYFAMSGVQAYLIFAQDDARVWIWQRSGEGWARQSEMVSGTDKEFVINALNITVALKDVYSDLDFSS